MRPKWFLLLLWLHAEAGLAQAPESAGLWRVAAAALSAPPALQRGPEGLSWNPSADLGAARLSAGIALFHTSSQLGMDGIVAGISTSLGNRAAVGVVLGRIDVRDLVRTTTTPNSLGGSIPVYAQYAGVLGQIGNRWARLATVVRLHDERFDFVSEHGFTVDIGARLHPTDQLTIAATTHFLPVDLSRRSTTDYYLGAEYEFAPELAVGSVTTTLAGRYGATLKSGETLEHTVGLAVQVAGVLELDAAITREVGYETYGLRPGLAIGIHVGRYHVVLGRSNGLNDLGATYRIGANASVLE